MSFRHPGPLAQHTNTLALAAWGAVLVVAIAIMLFAILQSGGGR